MAQEGTGAKFSFGMIFVAIFVLVMIFIVGNWITVATVDPPEVFQNEATIYWATQVRPIQILKMGGSFYENGAPENGEIELLLRNVDMRGNVSIRNIILSPLPNGARIAVYGAHSKDGSISGQLLGHAGEGMKAQPNMNLTLAPNETRSVYLRADGENGFFCNNANNSLRFKNKLTFQYDSKYFSDVYVVGVHPIAGECKNADAQREAVLEWWQIALFAGFIALSVGAIWKLKK